MIVRGVSLALTGLCFFGGSNTQGCVPCPGLCSLALTGLGCVGGVEPRAAFVTSLALGFVLSPLQGWGGSGGLISFDGVGIFCEGRAVDY